MTLVDFFCSLITNRWMRPSVVCPRVSARCREVERIVFFSGFSDASGRMVEIKCESCAYCLDMPAHGRRRHGRSLDTNLSKAHPTQQKGCHHLRCPILPPCQVAKMTNVSLGDNYCRRCPACYDGTIVNSLT